ncbi:MAG: sialidase family protein [Acidobacteria bacterium]|nr:sialidase family protein [Acidobacteriota bacterium]
MRLFTVGVLLISCSIGWAGEASAVRLLRVPGEGIQPQTVSHDGVLHVIYFKGERTHGDLFYVRSADGGAGFSEPLQVNSQAGSAVAAGTIRGGQIALGPQGLIHVVWNGSSVSQPRGPMNPEQPADSPHNGLPMLYSRLGADGQFEPQRNLMRKTFALDGGGSVAADEQGNVYVAWHGSSEDSTKGEAGRVVWLAKSTDGGQTFSEETPAFEESTGACGCCGMQVFADSRGRLLALYRSARETVHRDIYLLASGDRGKTFRSQRVDPWEIGACPMSSMSFSEGPAGVLAAWETAGQVFFGRIESQAAKLEGKTAAPGEADHRKHPRLAQNSRGETLLVWAEVQGWGKAGELGWQLFSREGAPLGEAGSVHGLPAWSFGTPVADSDGGFLLIY